MPESPGWRYTICETPTCKTCIKMVMSGLGILIWWHELSMLLIHHCILFLNACNAEIHKWQQGNLQQYSLRSLLIPLETSYIYLKSQWVLFFFLFFFSWANDNFIIFDKMLEQRKTIVRLGVNIDFSRVNNKSRFPE